MNIQKFDTPILFLIFNRLETTKQVFSAIQEIKPSKLFIAADGPRSNNINDEIACDKVRNFVLSNINWECEVKTLFRENNLGCGKAVSDAITWFFNNVEQGIILEDDCLPSQSFFGFCEKMLDLYKEDQIIFIISGFMDIPYNKLSSWDEYGFVKIPHIWGWATWKNRWDKYDFDVKKMSKNKIALDIKNIFIKKMYQEYWIEIFNKMINKVIDTWDYQLVYTIWRNNTLCIAPKKNLISNIGRYNGTHTKINSKRISYSKIYNVSIPYHKNHIQYNAKFDNYDMKKNIIDFKFKVKYFFNRININYLLKIIKPNN